MPPAGAIVPGTVLHGRYVVGRCVGTGSYGVVHAAEDLRFEREVALKILHRSDAAAVYALKREFRMLRDLRHPRRRSKV